MALSSSGNRFCDFKAWNVEMDVKCSIEEIFVHYEISVDAQKIKVYWPRIRQTYSCDLSVNVAAAVKDYGKEVIIRVLDNIPILLVERSCKWMVPLSDCKVNSQQSQLNLRLHRPTLTRFLLTSGIKHGQKFIENTSPKFEGVRMFTNVDINSLPTTLTTWRASTSLMLLRRILENYGTCKHNSFHVTTLNSQSLKTSNICSSSIKTLSSDHHNQMPCSWGKSVEGESLVGAHCESDENVNRTMQEATEGEQSVYINFRPVIWKNSETDLMSEYFRHCQIAMKTYNEKFRLSEHPTDINLISETCDNLVKIIATFNILATSPSSLVTLTCANDSTKNGTFVMYNYSRICSVISRFHQQVYQQIFPPLPPISDTDFSLLKTHEEWRLILFCLKYHKVIETVLSHIVSQSTKINGPPYHKIIEFMVDLSHYISLYYNRVHIIVEPFPHLLGTMNARIWLLTYIKELMEDVFLLLDISPICKM